MWHEVRELPDISNFTSATTEAISVSQIRDQNNIGKNLKRKKKEESEKKENGILNLLKEFQGIYETQKFSNMCLVLSVNCWAVF